MINKRKSREHKKRAFMIQLDVHDNFQILKIQQNKSVTSIIILIHYPLLR